MALGTLPDLLAINTELGLVLQGLSECITESGEDFDDQLDFAEYSAVVPDEFEITQGSLILFDDSGLPFQIIKIIASGAWTLTVSDSWIQIPGTTGTGNSSINVTCGTNFGFLREGNIYGELDSNSSINDTCYISQEGA